MSQVVEAQAAPPSRPTRRRTTGCALRSADQALRLASPPSTSWTSTYPAARSSRCSGPRAAARPRRCGWWPGSRRPTSGTITLAGQDITYAKPYRRPVNTVFQNYALFPHLDIFENVAFGLRRRKSGDVDKQVREMLELVELEQPGPQEAGPALRRPAAAGRAGPGADQQARGAAARRAARRARPQAAPRRCRSRSSGSRPRSGLHLHPRHPRPGGGHDHGRHGRGDERRASSSRWARPTELYENPRSTFVANFLGQSNLIEGTVTEPGRRPRHRRHARHRRVRSRPTGRTRRRRPGLDRHPARRRC